MIRDWRNNLIEVGSTIVYATTQSSSVTMVEGVVVDIIEKPIYAGASKTQPALKVERWGDHYDTWRTRRTGKPHDGDKKLVTLTSIDRVTVVPPRSFTIQGVIQDDLDKLLAS